ncbi:hypothetical protein BVX93_00540 [bacterium B13(2017)]|nr:hypothetical protein BVX93_00540 [bacterium B13(2017)]
MAKKSKTPVPSSIKIGNKSKMTNTSKSKRSVIVHKTQKQTEHLHQVLSKIEETIQELTRLFVEMESSKHRGVKGQFRLTPKQELIKKQLELANKRADQILKLLS